MKHHLPNLLTILSLLLSAAALVLWGRSYSVWDEWRLGGGARVRLVHSYGGRIAVGDLRLSPGDAARYAWKRYPIPWPLGWWVVQTPFVFDASWDAGLPVRHVTFPHWLVVATGGLLPALRCHRRRRRRRTRGHCAHCGYDLRATPDQCPECGERAGAAATPGAAA